MFWAFVYWIWKSRNERIFNGITMTEKTIIQIIRSDVRMKLNVVEYLIEEGTAKCTIEELWRVVIKKIGRNNKMVKWTKPSVGCFKINSYGSLNIKVGKWGAVYRNDEGKLVYSIWNIAISIH